MDRRKRDDVPRTRLEEIEDLVPRREESNQEYHRKIDVLREMITAQGNQISELRGWINQIRLNYRELCARYEKLKPGKKRYFGDN